MIKAIPNIITTLSLISGSISILLLSSEHVKWGSIFILIAAIFDFFDGFVARLVKAESYFGRIFDSISDMVSFGIAPSILMYLLIKQGLNTIEISNSISEILPYIVILLPVCSAIRLTRFTINDDENKSFKGIPTTAVGIFLASIGILVGLNDVNFTIDLLVNPIILIVIVTCTAFLEILPVPMLNIKYANYNWKGNEEKFSFIVFGLIMIIILGWYAIPVIFLCYILFSLILSIFQTIKK